MGNILPTEEEPTEAPVMMVYRDGCYVPAGPGNGRHGMPSASVFRVSNPPDIHRVGPPVTNPASLRPKLLSAGKVANGTGLFIEGVVDASDAGVVSLYRQHVPSDGGEPDDAFETWWRAERDGFPPEHNPAPRKWIGYADFARGKEQRFTIGPVLLGTDKQGAMRMGPADEDGAWRLVLVVSSGNECERVKENLREVRASRRASASKSGGLGAGLGLDLEVRPAIPDCYDLPIEIDEHTCVRVKEDGGWHITTLKQCVRVGDDLYEAEGVMYGCLGARRMPPGWGRKNGHSGGTDTPRSGISGSSQQEEEPGQTTCVICMLEPRDTALLPCRHLCMCSSCADVVRLRSQACPICRQSIQSLLSIDTPIEVA